MTIGRSRSAAESAERMRNRSVDDRGKVDGGSGCGRRMTWSVMAERGGRDPLGGLTWNLSGEEVWILKKMGREGWRERRWRSERHLAFSLKSIETSCSITCRSSSMVLVVVSMDSYKGDDERRYFLLRRGRRD